MNDLEIGVTAQALPCLHPREGGTTRRVREACTSGDAGTGLSETHASKFGMLTLWRIAVQRRLGFTGNGAFDVGMHNYSPVALAHVSLRSHINLGGQMNTREDIARTAGIVLLPGEGRSYPMGRITAVFKADGNETRKGYSISEWWLEPKTQGPGAHSHPEDDIFYVIEGTMSVLIGDRWTDAAKGCFVLVPGGVTHDFENRSSSRAGVLNFSIPGDFEKDMPEIVRWFAQNPPKDARWPPRPWASRLTSALWIKIAVQCNSQGVRDEQTRYVDRKLRAVVFFSRIRTGRNAIRVEALASSG